MDSLTRFKSLDSFLIKHERLWRPAPFTQLHLPWELEFSELSRWLRSRRLDQSDLSGEALYRLDAPEPFQSIARVAQLASELHELPRLHQSEPRADATSIPGRKWQQVTAFAEHIPRSKNNHWLDWCAGKGYLGRLLAQQGGTLTCLESDRSLVEYGVALSDRAAVNASHLCVDVMSPDVESHIHSHHYPVALHACGELHMRLLQLASGKGCQSIALSPCCYNRIKSENYQTLSNAARASGLRLHRNDLALPLRESVTAGARERRQRDQSMAWRLAFDLLQRELRGTDEYLSTPSLPTSWLQKPFKQFCCDLANLRHLPRPGERDWHALENQGWRRLAEVRNLELLRALFRRPMEVWLLLDRVMMLEERGYRVQLGTFCDVSVTPRNALILATMDAKK